MGRSVGKKFGPPVDVTIGGSKRLSGFNGPLALIQKQVKRLPAEASLFPNAGLGATGGLEDLVSDAHDLNGKEYLHQVNRDMPGQGKDSVYRLDMENSNPKPKPKPWPRHVLLKGWVDRWVEEKATNFGQRARRAQCAEALGISVDSLKQYCAGLQIPGRVLMANIVKVFKDYGARPQDLVDDQGAEPMPGIEPEAWQEADEEARSFAAMIFHEAKGMNSRQRKAILDIVRASKGLGKQS